MRKEKEKEEEEEIRHVWPFYVLSLNPSKQKKSSKTGNRCNQYKQPTVNGSAVTAMPLSSRCWVVWATRESRCRFNWVYRFQLLG